MVPLQRLLSKLLAWKSRPPSAAIFVCLLQRTERLSQKDASFYCLFFLNGSLLLFFPRAEQGEECAVHGHDEEKSLRDAVAVSTTLITSPPRPAMKDLLGSTTPNLRRDHRVQTMINRLSCDCTPPSRYSFGECAKGGDSASMRSTIGAPDDR